MNNSASNHVHVLACVIIFLLRRLYCADIDGAEDILTTRIGVLISSSKGSGIVNTSIEILQMKIDLIWHHVDTDEIYQVLKAMNKMDMDKTLDGIVIFLDNQNLQLFQQISKSVAKPVVDWLVSERTLLENLEPLEDYANCTTGYAQEGIEESLNGYDFIARTDYLVTAPQFVTLNTPDIIRSLVALLTWKVVIIIHETATETQTAKTIHLLSRHGTIVVTLNIDQTPTLHRELHKVYHTEVIQNGRSRVNFLVFCRFNCVREVLAQANIHEHTRAYRRSLLKHLSLWLIIIHGFTPTMENVVRACASELDNVAMVALPDTATANSTQSFILAMKSVLLEMQQSGIVSTANRTLGSWTLSLLRQKALMRNPALFREAFSIKTLLWTTVDRGFSNVGYVRPTGSIELWSSMFPNSQYGFNKRELLVSSLAWKPFVIKENNNGTVMYRGLCFDLLNEIAKLLNFTYRVTAPVDEYYGSMLPNGSWNGFVGQLERKEVDMVVAGLTVDQRRAQVMDFTFPFYYDYASILVKRPDPDDNSWRKLLDPFHWLVLVTICTCLLFATSLTYIMERHNPFYRRSTGNRARRDEHGPPTFHDLFLYMYMALCNEGGVEAPNSFTGRTMVSAWLIFAIVIAGIYTGNLIAFLTATNTELPFTTLNELTQMKGKFTWGFLPSTFYEVNFKTSKNPVFQAVWDGVVEFNRSDPDVLNFEFDIHVEKVRRGGYAFLQSKMDLEFELAKAGFCDLQRVDDFLPERYAIGLPKNSPLTKVVSQMIMRVEDAGLMKIWKERLWPKSNKCKTGGISDAEPTRLLDVQAALYLSCAGVFIAAIVLGSEKAVHCWRQRVQRSKVIAKQQKEEDVLG